MFTRRLQAATLAVIFLVGALLLPTLHRLHCAAEGDAHEATQCVLCQLAGSPVIEAASHVQAVGPTALVADLVTPDAALIPAVRHVCSHARAPPAA